MGVQLDSRAKLLAIGTVLCVLACISEGNTAETFRCCSFGGFASENVQWANFPLLQ